MDIEKLIEGLKTCARLGDSPIMDGFAVIADKRKLDVAATALSTLQAENAEMQKQLNEFSEFLCRMTGGLLSKTNYTAQEMATAAEDYQQKVCGECDLQAENEKLRAELERVKAERDAAVEDVAAIIGNVEEIRQGYGVGNVDADDAFAELCGTYCANKGRSCYAECERYHCKNFKWRSPQKENKDE